MTIEHLVIPDPQVTPGCNTDHLEAAANYACHKLPNKIIFLGDFADMHSLGVYDVGRKAGEGARYQDDIECARVAMDRFFDVIYRKQKQQRKKHKPLWSPEVHLTLGNHENRITRHVETYPVLEGKLSVTDLGFEEHGIIVHPFLSCVELDGILYSHYFPRNAQGRIVQTYRGAPSAAQQVKREMQSCTSGHLQGLDIHIHQTGDDLKIGLIAGSFYSHNPDYLSPQGTAYWRGIIYKHQVRDGVYDPMFVSMDYLLENWL